MRVLVAALLLLSLAGCSGDKQSAPAPAETRSGANGVTVALPDGWHELATDDGAITDPVTQVAVSSGPMAIRDTQCQVSDYGPEDDAVALIVLEWQPNDDIAMGPRPEHFGSAELPITPGNIECFDGSGGTVQFSDAGRMFGAYLLLGPDADPQLADEARAVLETLEVEPAAG